MTPSNGQWLPGTVGPIAPTSGQPSSGPCIIDPTLPPAFNTGELNWQPPVVRMTPQNVAFFTGSWPYWISWKYDGSQIAYMDASGNNQQPDPDNKYRYQGTTTAQQLVATGCECWWNPPTNQGIGGQPCPPGWRQMPGNMCEYCPTGVSLRPCHIVPAKQAWAEYLSQQAGSSGAGGSTGLTRLGPPPPPPPPFPPPPSPPPLSPLSLGGSNGSITGGGAFVTGGGGTANATSGQGTITLLSPPGQPMPGCQGPYAAPPPVSRASGLRVVQDANGQWWICPANGQSPPPPPPPFSPPSPSSSTTQCPQTYTIVQGPPCPQYVAILGTPDSWRAQGIQLPPGWTALNSLTDTPDVIQNAVNALVSRCVASSIPTQPKQS